MEQANINSHEVRTLQINNIVARSTQADKMQVVGVAAVYGQYTEIFDLSGESFYERISRDAVRDTLADGHEVFCLKDHDWGSVLGRTGANLSLANKTDGLHFELIPNGSSLGRDILEDVRSGLIKGCSIGFRVIEDSWEKRNGTWHRTILSLDLSEVTLTPFPAYTTTNAQVRSRITGPKLNYQRNDDSTLRNIENMLDEISYRLAILQADEILSRK